jgi:hypothetical protein
MNIKCGKCNQWFQFEDYKNHQCQQKEASYNPRYFFGPEVDSNGNIYHLESEDGVTWHRKLIRHSRRKVTAFKTDEDETEPYAETIEGVGP